MIQVGFHTYVICLVAVYLASWRGNTDFAGSFLVAASLVAILSQALLLGVERPSQFNDTSKEDVTPRLVANALLMSFIVVGFGAFVISKLSTALYGLALPNISTNLWGMVFIGLIPASLASQVRTLAKEIIGKRMLFSIESAAAFCFLVGIGVLSWLQRLSAEATLSLWIISTTVGAAVMTILIWTRTDNHKSVSFELLKGQISNGFKPLVIQLLFNLTYITPLLLCSQQLSGHKAGIFALTLLLSEAVWRVAALKKDVISNSGSESRDQLKEQLRSRLSIHLQRALITSLGVVVIGVLFFWIGLQRPLWDYTLWVFLPTAMTIYTFNRALLAYLKTSQRYSYFLIAGIIMFIAGFDLSLLFISWFGLPGAGLAFLLTQAVMAVFFLHSQRSLNGFTAQDMFGGPQLPIRNRGWAQGRQR